MRWLARLLLLRVLPRRLLPILTVWEVWKIVRGLQAARGQAARDQAARDQAARDLARRRATTEPPPGPATRRPTPR